MDALFVKKLITLLIFLSFIHPVKAQDLKAQASKAQDLAETFQLALLNDPVLKQSYYSQFSVAENRSQSIAQMLPTISVSGNSSRDRVNSKKDQAPKASEQVQESRTIGTTGFLSILLNLYFIGIIG